MEQPSNQAPRPTVLVVDDERRTVTSVKHLLRQNYHVLGAVRAQEALALLETEPVSVILCDQCMPEMTGDEFFAQVSQRYPDVVRVLITAYSDMGALVKSVNFGRIFAYLAKPWVPEELERVVGTAVEFFETRRRNHQMTRELKEANARLEHMNRELKSFNHLVAHDLKEPLRTIIAYAHFLTTDYKTVMDDEGIQFVGGINRCAHHLNQLVDDLLHFSTLEHGTPTLVEVNLSHVIAHQLQLMVGAIPMNAEIVVGRDLPVVMGDQSRLMLLFQNLITNALKFNRNPKPRVEIGSLPPADQFVEVYVRDNGIGIPVEFQDRIFDLFRRLHARTEYPGTGTGLAVVRRIVSIHGGSVRVESVPGQGATFYIRLRTPAIP